MNDLWAFSPNVTIIIYSVEYVSKSSFSDELEYVFRLHVTSVLGDTMQGCGISSVCRYDSFVPSHHYVAFITCICWRNVMNQYVVYGM